MAPLPATLAATESWPPNVEVARRNLAPLGATVVQVEDEAPLPCAPMPFDLVVSRHPTVAVWAEIAAVLRPVTVEAYRGRLAACTTTSAHTARSCAIPSAS